MVYKATSTELQWMVTIPMLKGLGDLGTVAAVITGMTRTTDIGRWL